MSKTGQKHAILPALSRPIIPYLTEGIQQQPALIAKASMVMIGGGELAELPQLLARMGRPPFDKLPVLLHIDLVNGLSNDESGLRYVATAFERIDGVIDKSTPDAVELLPGVAFLQVAERFAKLPMPCIAGGLIRTPQTVNQILAAGCKAVSTSNVKLWELNR